MPGWNDLGAAFSTLRELDVSAIREESERPVTIVCLGLASLVRKVVAVLRVGGGQRFGPVGLDPFVLQTLPASEPDNALPHADLLVIVVDGHERLSAADTRALTRLAELALPMLVVVCGVTSPGELGQPRPEFAHARIVVVPALDAPDAAPTLAGAILDKLPAELHLAAARAVPGLRAIYSRELVNSVSFTNATYALASAIPQQIPILAVPFVAADLIVLTKNQALMVYRMGLAHGAAPDFQARMAEIAPVIGGAFVWRQIARSLVALIPVWGVIPKVAVAYAGTFATGTAALRWFTDGEIVSGERLKALGEESLRTGRAIAERLVTEARVQSAKAGHRLAAQRHRKSKGKSTTLSPGGDE